jgi:hypothetical protein
MLRALKSNRAVLDDYIQGRKELTAVISSVSMSKFALRALLRWLAQHASLCEEWLLDASTDRYGQLRDLKARRQEA